jgi:hypothetical protein
MTVVIACDPSTAPNLALVCSERGWLDVAAKDRTSVKVTGSKNEPVAQLIAEVMREWALFYSPAWFVSEKIGPWSGQGLVSSANFVGAMRLVEGCAAGIGGMQVAFYTPPVWKRGVGLLTKDKDYSRALALKLFPNRAGWLATKNSHDQAEAALIGWHHLQTLKKGGA